MQLILKSELQIVAPDEVPSFCVEHMSSNIVISWYQNLGINIYRQFWHHIGTLQKEYAKAKMVTLQSTFKF